MIRGWLVDHEWRVLAVSLAMAVAAALGIGHEPSSPLGDGFVGIDLAGLAVLIGSAGTALSLRSRLSGSLAIRTPWWARAAWLAVASVALTMAVAASLGSAGASFSRVVNLCATVGFVATGLALLVGEGVALAFVFACAAITVATPRTAGDHVAWWSLVLNEGGGSPRLVVSCVLIAAIAVLYVRGRQWRRSGSVSI